MEKMDEFEFTLGEKTRIVEGAKLIGFVPLPYLAKGKEFDYSKVKHSITLKHVRSGKSINIEKWEFKMLGLNILLDDVADMLFMKLFKDQEDEDYVRYYQH